MSVKVQRRKSKYNSALEAWNSVAKRYGLKSAYGIKSAHTPTFWQWVIPDKYAKNPSTASKKTRKTSKKKPSRKFPPRKMRSGKVRKRVKRGRNASVVLANGKTKRNKEKKSQIDAIYKGAIIGLIPGTIEKIFYNRTGKNPGKYYHDFQSPADMLAMDDGSVLITPRDKGTKLWTKID